MMKTFSPLLALIALSMMTLMSTSCHGKDNPARDEQARRNVEETMNAYLNPQRLKVGSPVFIRIIKEERILELWGKPDEDKEFLLIKRYPIAGMSGDLGPKQKEGDMQAPEGFYEVTKQALNPHSNYHLSFNIGYPNAYDKALGRTGSLIMIHGSNVSVGCFAITDEGIEEVYTMVAEALKNGQPVVPVQIYPFIPTIERMAREQNSEFSEFWQILQQGWAHTERHKTPAPYRVNGKELSIRP